MSPTRTTTPFRHFASRCLTALPVFLGLQLSTAASAQVPPEPDGDPQPPAAALPEAPAYGARARSQRPAAAQLDRNGTASRVNAPLEELPSSVTVLDAAAMRERGALSLDQALTAVPGMTPVWQYGGFLSLSMRGFQAITLMDGHRDTRAILAESAPQGALFDLDRIEVLRGPASVLYGYGAVGGVVNLIRRHASRTPEYTLDLGLGLPDQQVIHGAAQGPLGSMFAYRVDVGRATATDYRGASTERNQVTTNIAFTPTRDHAFGLRLSYNRDHYNTDVGIPTVEDPNKPGTWGLPVGARLDARYNTKNDFLAYQRLELGVDYRWDISRVTYLQARGNLVHDYYDYLAAESLTYVPGMDMQRASVDREYLHFARGWTPAVGQLELHSELDTGPIQHRLVLGYELSGLYGLSDRGNTGDAVPGSVDFRDPEDAAAPSHALQRTSQDHYRHITNSLYAFDHVHLLENLIVTGGLRFDTVGSRVQRTFLDLESGADAPDPRTGSTRRPLRKTSSALTGQVGVVYTPVEPLTLYVGYASAFKPNFVYPSDTSANAFDPERSQQVEGGVRVRSEISGHTLSFDGAGYYIAKRNVVQSRGSDDYEQAGKVESKGLDLALRYAAPAFVGVDVSYALTSAEFKEFVSPDPVTGENRNLARKQPGFVPRHTGQLWLRLAFNTHVGLGVGGRWVADQYADNENRLPMPNYALLDMSAWLRAGRVSFVLSARNVLDKRNYFTSSINSYAVNPQVTPGPNREILGTLRITL